VNIQQGPQAGTTNVLKSIFRAEKKFFRLKLNHIKCFNLFWRVGTDLVFRDIFVVFTICFNNYKAFSFVVTIYKVRESWVEKEVGFHLILEQTRKFHELAILVWPPINLLAIWLKVHVTFKNAEEVIFDNNHKSFGILTENKLESSIYLKLLLFIIIWFDFCIFFF